ncbi:FkbM family methyltransferase [Psychroserpens sp. Hel_I_66]|uniref:FkbM family methyltransferase n=1 Tax=Psychroserpens sp. Hel_I_66 TaxID=1250004 RepID=UPI0006475FC5|nr:FkbM family methyltransferase [Psychroserpens sp. Hel_I_66]
MINLFNIVSNYGIKGLKSYVKLKIGRIEFMALHDDNGIKIYIPGYKNPIYLRSDTSDFATFRQVFVAKEYDIDFDFEPNVIIDAGANVGLAAIYFANRFPNANIYSIEPEFTNIELLKKNVSPYEYVRFLPMALHHTSNLTLNIIDEGIGKWGFVTKAHDDIVDANNIVGSVNTICLNEIMDNNNIELIDILKVDIEGAEKFLFEKNYERWLPKTRCVIVELHDRWYPGCKESVFNAMNAYNFKHYEKGENVIFLNLNYAI